LNRFPVLEFNGNSWLSLHKISHLLLPTAKVCWAVTCDPQKALFSNIPCFPSSQPRNKISQSIMHHPVAQRERRCLMLSSLSLSSALPSAHSNLCLLSCSNNKTSSILFFSQVVSPLVTHHDAPSYVIILSLARNNNDMRLQTSPLFFLYCPHGNDTLLSTYITALQSFSDTSSANTSFLLEVLKGWWDNVALRSISEGTYQERPSQRPDFREPMYDAEIFKCLLEPDREDIFLL
jgi:hypothetical protein